MNTSPDTFSKDNLSIRKVSSEEIPEVVSLWNLFIKHHYDSGIDLKLVPHSASVYEQYLRQALDKKENILLVAEIDNKIIGYTLGGILKTSGFFQYRNTGKITELFVEKGYRQHRVGYLLLDEIIKWFTNNNITRIETEYYVKNSVAEKFWNSLSFAPERLLLVLDKT